MNTVKICKVKPEVIGGKLVFTRVVDVKEEPIEKIRKTKEFRQASRVLRQQVAHINRSREINKERLSMRFVG